MITRVLSVSLLAGLCAGLLVAVLQHFSATPLILRAETYESHEKVSSTRDLSPGVVLATAVQTPQNIVAPKIILAHAHGGADHATTASDGWKPENGLERTAFTGLVTVGTAIGFAFLLIGAMLATGDRITPHTALAYAGAAFFAIGLAPAAGLAPELPGSASAALEVRQIWWIGTALASALGVFLVLKQRSLWLAALGFGLLLLPHVIGAPHPGVLESKVPAELAARFTGLSIVLQGVLWLTVGYLTGVFWQRLEDKAAA